MNNNLIPFTVFTGSEQYDALFEEVPFMPRKGEILGGSVVYDILPLEADNCLAGKEIYYAFRVKLVDPDTMLLCERNLCMSDENVLTINVYLADDNQEEYLDDWYWTAPTVEEIAGRYGLICACNRNCSIRVLDKYGRTVLEYAVKTEMEDKNDVSAH